MVHGSQQFTPKQLLDAGQRAEAEGRLDLAHQFYEHLSDRYGHAPEAAEGRNGLARIAAGGPYPQVWESKGAIPRGQRPMAGRRLGVPGAPSASRGAVNTGLAGLWRRSRAPRRLGDRRRAVGPRSRPGCGFCAGACPAGAQERLRPAAAGGRCTAGRGCELAGRADGAGAVRSGQRDARAPGARAGQGRDSSGLAQRPRRCSSSRGMISTKLQGRWRLSSCQRRMSFQASLQAPGEPGRQKM